MAKSEYNFQRNLAIVIGIDEYSNGIPSLKTPVADAKKLSEILQRVYKYEVQLLLNSQASFSGLNSLLANFKNKKFPLGDITVQVEENDRVLFYFAGHGIAPVDTLENNDDCRGHLVPSDAKTDILFQKQNLLLPMQALHDALAELPCRHMLVILDCCFAGAFRSSSYKNVIGVRKVYKQRFDRFISERAWQAIASAANDQKALDVLGFFGKRETENTQEHSPFASALFEALQGDADTTLKRGDGIITATEIYSYVRDKVEQITNEHNVRQTPILFPFKKHDKGEFIFVLPHFNRDKLEDAPALNPENNPYRGLKSYEEKHSQLFFGRDELISQLYTHVNQSDRQLTVVLGVSGSGKSSLVKAGLIPYLRSHHKEEFEILPTIRPGKSPFIALSESVLRNAYTATAEQQEEIHHLSKTLKQAPTQLINIIEKYSQVPANTKFLLVMDEFEELFTMCKQKEREDFLNFLAQALEANPQLYIVLTLRSDFEPRFIDCPLKSTWMAARFLVRAMKSEELRACIERPARDKMLDFDPPALVDRLIDEVGQMPGALSLLSFTLSELYIKCVEQEKRTLRAEDYEILGGVAGSLTRRATEEYNKLTPAQRATMKRVMLRMVTNEGGESARRRVPLLELEYVDERENQRVQEVLTRLSQARLIVGGQETGGEPYVEPAHDVLVRGWEKLQQWKLQEQENMALQQRLTPAVNDWCKNNRTANYLWIRDPRLLQLEKALQSKDNNWLNQVETEFVRDSVLRRKDELEETKKLLQISEERRARAELQLKAAKVQNLLPIKPLDSLVLAVATIGQNLEELPMEILSPVQSSLRIAVEKARERDILGDGYISAVAISPNKQHIAYSVSHPHSLHLCDFQGDVIRDLPIPNGNDIQCLTFSPDSQTLVAVSHEYQVYLWDVNGNFISSFAVSEDTINSIAFSPDGQKIITGSSGSPGKVQLWNLKGNLIRDFTVFKEGVNSVAFSPDGQYIVTASVGNPGKVQLWNLKGSLVKEFPAIKEGVNSVAFSPNGQHIVSGSAGTPGKVQLWSLKGKLIKSLVLNEEELDICEDGVKSVAFTTDGRKIIGISQCEEDTLLVILRLWNLEGDLLQKPALYPSNIAISADGICAVTGSGGNRGKVTIWDLQGNEIDVFSEHKASINSVAVSAHGQNIVSLSDDGIAWLRNLKGNTICQQLRHKSAVKSVAISTDGQTIASGCDNGGVRLWDSQGHLVREFQAYQSVVNSIVVSNDGMTIITCGSDDMSVDKIRLWDLGGNKIDEIFFEGQTTPLRKVAISPDGQSIVSISDVVNIQFWNGQGELIAETSEGHSSFIISVAISADGQTIVTSSDDETLRLWDRWGQPIGEPLPNPIPWSITVSPDGQYIVSGSRDNYVRLWDRQGNLIGEPLQGHKDVVSAVAMSDDGQTIVSGSWDGIVRLWQGGNWKNWLQVACDRLRYHPIFNELPTEVEKQACETCKKYVWERRR